MLIHEPQEQAGIQAATQKNSNWNIAQTVTVTGVDDPVYDGNIAYKIAIGPAVSDDPAYNGLKAADLALTNVDTLNLEIALGARARNPTMPIVLRIAEASFAESIARHFEFETTFSAAALAAPAFVGLGRFSGSRGRVRRRTARIRSTSSW